MQIGQEAGGNGTGELMSGRRHEENNADRQEETIKENTMERS